MGSILWSRSHRTAYQENTGECIQNIIMLFSWITPQKEEGIKDENPEYIVNRIDKTGKFTRVK